MLESGGASAGFGEGIVEDPKFTALNVTRYWFSGRESPRRRDDARRYGKPGE
jgi:hypothetical protein